MRMEVETVTPAMAEAWLASAAGLPQRHLTPGRVRQFASAMTRGQWRVTHQGIAIDPDGVLIDGQHRLSAVVLSGVTVQMMVAYDVPRETFDAFDTGQARTTASTLHIAGIVDANATAAAARLILTYDQIGETKRSAHSDIRSGATTRDVLNFIESSRGETLRGALPVARSLAQTFNRYGMRSWLAAAVTIIDETAPDAMVREEFLDKMHSGAMLADQSPILTFRRWLISETGYARSDRSYRSPVGVAAYIKTWNAWTMGRDLGVIRMRVGREEWPIPGRDLEAEAEAIEARLDAERAEQAERGEIVAA